MIPLLKVEIIIKLLINMASLKDTFLIKPKNLFIKRRESNYGLSGKTSSN